ncbi:hypothetical protein AAK899_12675, partial [Erysipelotrichaceae bacterium 51-3]
KSKMAGNTFFKGVSGHLSVLMNCSGFMQERSNLLQAILCYRTFSCPCLRDIIPKNKRGRKALRILNSSMGGVLRAEPHE